jgi:hypothetical protein
MKSNSIQKWIEYLINIYYIIIIIIILTHIIYKYIDEGEKNTSIYEE